MKHGMHRILTAWRAATRSGGLLAVALVAAACGGDAASNPAPTPQVAEEAEASAAPVIDDPEASEAPETQDPEATATEPETQDPEETATQPELQDPEATATEPGTQDPEETATQPELQDPEATATVADSAADVVEAYRVAYNADDIDAIMALFTEESMLTDHPAALFGGVGSGGDTLIGLDEIRGANIQDRANAAESGAYEFLNVEIDDNTITWDHTWVGSNLAEWCGEGHSAVIVDGVFVSWTYAPDTHPCSPDCGFEDVFGDGIVPEVCRRP